jgi:hypothetical protein
LTSILPRSYFRIPHPGYKIRDATGERVGD